MQLYVYKYFNVFRQSQGLHLRREMKREVKIYEENCKELIGLNSINGKATGPHERAC